MAAVLVSFLLPVVVGVGSLGVAASLVRRL